MWVNPFVPTETNIDTFANSADPDETARNEPSHLDLNCLPIRWGGGRGEGKAKVSCILRHRGVQLILAYRWTRPVILSAGMGGGKCFYFLCFFTLIHFFLSPLSLSFISKTTSSISHLSFTGRRHKMTHVSQSINLLLIFDRNLYLQQWMCPNSATWWNSSYQKLGGKMVILPALHDLSIF